jgi:hypothetical protein
MKRHIARIAAVSALALASVSCIGLLDNSEVAVNISGLKGTFDVTPGVQNFNQCTTVNPAQYLDVNFDNLRSARIYDVRALTNAPFPGTLQMTVTVNGVAFLTGGGAWNSFNGGKSVLTSGEMQIQQAGVTALLDAVNGRNSITFCGSGSSSQPFTAGLRVEVEVLGQVDAQI